MKSKEQFITEYKEQNPKLYKGINDEVFELTVEEYENACDEWAEIQFQIQQQAQEVLDKAAQKQTLLARLGITADEAKLLLS